MLAHGIEYFYIIGVIIVLILLKIRYRQLKKRDIKMIVVGSGIGILLPIIYSFIFAIVYIFQDALSTAGVKGTGFFPKGFLNFVGVENPVYQVVTYPFLYSQFKIISIIIMIGILISMFLLIKNFWTKKFSVALLMGFFGLLFGSLNFIGFRKSFQTRFLWPIFLAVFFGIAFYFIINTILRSLKKQSLAKIIYPVLTIVLITIIFTTYYEAPEGLSAIDQYHWEAITWFDDKIIQEDAENN